MKRVFAGGKRDREAQRDRKKKEKAQRLEYNRAMRAQGRDPDIEQSAAPEPLPEVKLEDVVIGVAKQERRNTTGPVKLFVGGLSWGTSSDDLRQAFARFGALIEAVIVNDRATGRSRGFGFVTFEKAPDAMEAIKSMNGAELDGRILKVNQADSR
jgi:cold-inducible RNA-binding protein